MEITNARQARKLIGRKIVRVELNRFATGRMPGEKTSNPRIYLDDGSYISFIAAETEGDDYGIDLHHRNPNRAPEAERPDPVIVGGSFTAEIDGGGHCPIHHAHGIHVAGCASCEAKPGGGK